MLFEWIDEPIAEFNRHWIVQRDARLFGQDDIGESNLTESEDKVSCRFKIFEVWRDYQD
jgi:hypothetical protein